MPTRPRAARWAGAAAVSAAALVLTSCAAASAGGAPRSEGPPCPVAAVDVVASIEQWGDVAAALGGACAQVTTIVTGSWVTRTTTSRRRATRRRSAGAQLLVLNGLHYDDWAEKVVETLDAMPAEVVGGAVVGLEPAAGSDAAPAATNPHLWYSPSYVRQVAAAITAALAAQAPDAATYFEARAAQWQAAMKPYDDLVARIRAGATGQDLRRHRGCLRLPDARRSGSPTRPPGLPARVEQRQRPAPGDLPRSRPRSPTGSDRRARLQHPDRGRGPRAAAQRRRAGRRAGGRGHGDRRPRERIRSSRGRSPSSRSSPTRWVGARDARTPCHPRCVGCRSRDASRQRRPRRPDGLVRGHVPRPRRRRRRRHRAERRRARPRCSSCCSACSRRRRARRGAGRAAAPGQPPDRLRAAELHRGARRRDPLPRPRHARAHRRPLGPAADVRGRARPGSTPPCAAVGARSSPTAGCRELSGGQQQRVAIAQAHRRRPRAAAARRAAGQPRPAQPAGDRRAARRAAAATRDVTILVVAHDLNPLLPVLTGAIYLLDGHPHYDDDRRRRRRGAAHPPLRHADPRRPHRAGRPVHPERLTGGAAGSPTSASSPNWLDILQTPFMRNAFIGGTLVALAAGLLGYFVVIRRERVRRPRAGPHRLPRRHRRDAHRRAGHARAGGVLHRRRPAIGALGKRVAEREIATGTILAFATGARRAVQLAGDRERQHRHQRAVRQPAGDLDRPADRSSPVFTAASPSSSRSSARPLLFASVDPQVAEAQGRAGARARHRVHGAAGARDHDGGAGGRHAAAVRARRHAGRDRHRAHARPAAWWRVATGDRRGRRCGSGSCSRRCSTCRRASSSSRSPAGCGWPPGSWRAPHAASVSARHLRVIITTPTTRTR